MKKMLGPIKSMVKRPSNLPALPNSVLNFNKSKKSLSLGGIGLKGLRSVSGVATVGIFAANAALKLGRQKVNTIQGSMSNYSGTTLKGNINPLQFGKPNPLSSKFRKY